MIKSYCPETMKLKKDKKRCQAKFIKVIQTVLQKLFIIILRQVCDLCGEHLLQTRVYGFAFQGQDTENTFIDPVQRFFAYKPLKCF
jgi:hypothetical protein